ncbi:hypothetical protein SAY87_020783 [Trapa incisa]|uniref:Uncharacterized protein n=1 Tax=Trapa incisa TaxID=236973 RepID=A0AAN7PUS0_9MYRT|nr:hypothetical protein SAY87_020783 [Trapa incisa]
MDQSLVSNFDFLPAQRAVNILRKPIVTLNERKEMYLAELTEKCTYLIAEIYVALLWLKRQQLQLKLLKEINIKLPEDGVTSALLAGNGLTNQLHGKVVL